MSEFTRADEIEHFVIANDENPKMPTKVLRWLSAYAATLRQQAEQPSDDEPRLFSYDATVNRESVRVRWPGVDDVLTYVLEAEQPGVVVSDEVIAAFERAMKTCNGPLVTQKANDAAAWDAVSFFQSHAKAVAPLLRAPAERGGMVDEAMVERAVRAAYWYDTTERLHIDNDTMEVALQAAIAQNVHALGDFVRLPDAERVVLGQQVAERVDEMENMRGEAVADRPAGFGIACTVTWTELHAAMTADGMTPPNKCGKAMSAWIGKVVRDYLHAERARVQELDAEDWKVLQRLRNALPDVGLNGWHRGVTVLSKILSAAPSAPEGDGGAE